MSYTPTEWKTGDVITAEKLNNMEDGIVKAGRVFKVTVTGDGNNGFTLNKTCGEIKAAIMNGSFVWFQASTTVEGETVYNQVPAEGLAFIEGGGCSLIIMDMTFTARTDNDYPTQDK